VELDDDWNLWLPGLRFEQALCIAGVVRTWPNVLGNDVINPKEVYICWWNYITAEAILSINKSAIDYGKLTYPEKRGCEHSQYEVSEWLTRAEMGETFDKTNQIELVWSDSWDVMAAYLTQEQASIIVKLSETWPNIREPQAVFGRRLMKRYWDYSTTRMMLDTVDDALASGDLQEDIRVIANRLKMEYEKWLRQASPVEDEEGYWRH
jgi:hypothetical protein